MTVEFRVSEASVTELRVRLRTDPHLRAALERVADRTGLTVDRVREHFDGAVLRTADILGLDYVQDFETAKANVQRLRARVHQAYDLLFEPRSTKADIADLDGILRELAADAAALADPQRWARDQAAKPRPPVPTVEITPEQRANNRRISRETALPEERRTAFQLARSQEPDLVAAALRGEPKAAAGLRRALAAKGVHDWAIDRALEAIGDIREPGPDYAFGAGISGLRTGPVEVRAAFRDLPAGQRDMVNRAILADPDFVRAAVIAESDGPQGRRELDRFCSEQGITGEQRAALEAGLRSLNEAHRESQHTIRPGETGSLQARARARTLDRTAASMGLPTRDDVARRLVRSSAVLEMDTRSPGHLEQFIDNWLTYAERNRREGRPVATLERYVRALSRSHVRGILGELSAVFQLSDEFWVIKVPDLKVTVGGTDFVLVSKTTGELWYGDNKALSSHGLGEVTSLMQNIDDNMAADVAEFWKLLGREDVALPPKVVDAIRHATDASAAVKAFIDNAAGGQPVTDALKMTDTVQREITRILDEKGIRRVVTNAGGERLAGLTKALNEYIDFINTNEPGPHEPTRPPAAAGTAGPEGSVP